MVLRTQVLALFIKRCRQHGGKPISHPSLLDSIRLNRKKAVLRGTGKDSMGILKLSKEVKLTLTWAGSRELSWRVLPGA
jgi:hypothetical protein